MFPANFRLRVAAKIEQLAFSPRLTASIRWSFAKPSIRAITFHAIQSVQTFPEFSSPLSYGGTRTDTRARICVRVSGCTQGEKRSSFSSKVSPYTVKLIYPRTEREFCVLVRVLDFIVPRKSTGNACRSSTAAFKDPRVNVVTRNILVFVCFFPLFSF